MPNFTKQAIKASFMKLLNEQPLSKISVRSIVEDCGINRNSFYYHFQDIPTLLGEIVREYVDELIEKYPTVKQAVLFLLFSFICGTTQMIITFALPAILRAISPETMGPGTGFDFFVFRYTKPGLGEFIGFLVGSIWGQTLTFILNRKKTFNVPDHVAFRAIAYTVMAVLIVIMQTAIGGGISTGFKNAFPKANDSLIAVYNLIGQVVAGIAALVVSFLGNKFFIMRQWKSKKPASVESEAIIDGEAQAEAAATEENDKE